MIDPEARANRIVEAGSDSSVGIILLDVVLGYGANLDPASPVAAAATAARAAAEADGRRLEFVASVCGTPADPQGIERQRAILRDAGIILAETNASAVRFIATQQAGVPQS